MLITDILEYLKYVRNSNKFLKKCLTYTCCEYVAFSLEQPFHLVQFLFCHLLIQHMSITFNCWIPHLNQSRQHTSHLTDYLCSHVFQ